MCFLLSRRKIQVEKLVMPWNFLGYNSQATTKLFLQSSLSRKSLSQNTHTGKVFNVPRSFNGERTSKKASETAKFNYKHSINLLNALPRLRHHSHLWHFIFNSLDSQWKLKTHKYAFCISQHFFSSFVAYGTTDILCRLTSRVHSTRRRKMRWWVIKRKRKSRKFLKPLSCQLREPNSNNVT